MKDLRSWLGFIFGPEFYNRGDKNPNFISEDVNFFIVVLMSPALLEAIFYF